MVYYLYNECMSLALCDVNVVYEEEEGEGEVDVEEADEEGEEEAAERARERYMTARTDIFM